jgi:flavoprotein
MLTINKRAFVDREKCRTCWPCTAMEKCAPGVMQEEDGFSFVGLGCLGCGICAKACPYRAVVLY